MKSMTDFIMEQETVKVVEEEFDEAKLVSEYMAVCAAAANVACVCEYASIASFCEANGIEAPALIQEGATLDAILGAIGGFFQRIAEWFLGFVKGVTKAAGKSKLSELIAKLKSLDNQDELIPDTKEYRSVVLMANLSRVILTLLEMFKEDFTDTAAYYNQPNDLAQSSIRDNMYTKWGLIKEDLQTLNDTTKWKTSEGAKNTRDWNTIFKSAELKNMNLDRNGTDKTLTVAYVPYTGAAAIGSNIGDLVSALELVLKLNIPDKGDKIIKDFEIKLDKMKKYETTADPATGAPITKKSANEDKEMTKRIQECANGMAKVYDKMAAGFVDATLLATKDIKVDFSNKEKKEKYNEDVENAEKDKQRYKAKSDLKAQLDA